MKKITLLFCFFSFQIFAKTNSSQVPILDAADKIYEKLGQKIDVNLNFTNQDGKTQTIHNLLENKSVLILTLNYYRCTTMCTFQFLNLAQILKESPIPPSNGYGIATISFDPTDTVQKAKEIHDIWVPKSGVSQNAWNFFVSSPQNIEPLAKQLNFYYQKDDEGNYSHAAALFFIQPDGTLYRYLYGIVYNQSDFIYALSDASSGKLGTLLDKFYRLFNRYNPQRGKYFSLFHTS